VLLNDRWVIEASGNEKTDRMKWKENLMLNKTKLTNNQYEIQSGKKAVETHKSVNTSQS
jgi:hypothetical protein